MTWSRVASGAAAASAAALLALHFVSPEFDPAWRMVSEYANGGYGWLLTVFFLGWAASSWAIAVALWSSGSWVVRVGAALVALSGVGELMGGLFDVNHPWHGAAFALGVPTLALGAPIVGIALAVRDRAPLLGVASQAPWISVGLMAGSFALVMSSAQAAGVALTPGEPWGEVPPGVTAVMGWANRLLVASYLGWTALVARHLGARGA
ncbi:MAG: DUF998 domain-containing protein [Myxococcota bacterium]